MKCQGKEIKPDDKQECPNDANGMFRTTRGTLPLCLDHSTYAKQNKLLVRFKDNYFG